MHDLVIRNGTIVDGTGAAPVAGDVAVDGDRIVAVDTAGSAGRAHREIDADGRLVLPGWVDVHTHYDGQATWDPELTPSSWHGVTTTVFGNCGVGFAPLRPGTQDYLINLMEGVEDIPGSVLAEGIDFTWSTFEEYLDELARTPRIMDVGVQIPHGALRFYVMGERGADHEEIPTEDEIGRMADAVASALAAGALGFSTSRTTKHKAADGRLTPSLTAAEPELAGIADAMRRAGAGMIQCNSDFGDGEIEILTEMARRSGRPVSVLLLQVDHDPDRWRRTLDGIHRANAEGLSMTGQVGCRPIGIMMGLDTSVHPFGNHPAYRAIADLPVPERAARMRNDETLRAALLTERPDDGFTRWMSYALGRTFELGTPPDYEPDPSRSLAALAERAGGSPWELALDLLADGDGDTLLLYPFENYTAGNLDVIREMLIDDHTICGLGDGGAHVSTICDASYPTYLLTHWARDRTRGEGIELARLVRKQTWDTARAFGLLDRGVIRPGYKADLNVVDFDHLAVTPPTVIHDLPAGGRRLIQRSVGYDHTVVSGVEVSTGGEPTGARPGGLLRGATTRP
ncbi:MAG: amidohydrolase family protein [Actinomycetota bacterium]